MKLTVRQDGIDRLPNGRGQTFERSGPFPSANERRVASERETDAFHHPSGIMPNFIPEPDPVFWQARNGLSILVEDEPKRFANVFAGLDIVPVPSVFNEPFNVFGQAYTLHIDHRFGVKDFASFHS